MGDLFVLPKPLKSYGGSIFVARIKYCQQRNWSFTDLLNLTTSQSLNYATADVQLLGQVPWPTLWTFNSVGEPDYLLTHHWCSAFFGWRMKMCDHVSRMYLCWLNFPQKNKKLAEIYHLSIYQLTYLSISLRGPVHACTSQMRWKGDGFSREEDWGWGGRHLSHFPDAATGWPVYLK